MKVTIESEADLWKMFSDAADRRKKPPTADCPGQHIISFDDLLLAIKRQTGRGIKLTDERRRYHLSGTSCRMGFDPDARTQATVTQANLRRVGMAMRRKYRYVYVQFLGRWPS